MNFFLHRRIEPRAAGVFDPKWISRQQGLAKDNPLTTLICRRGYMLDYFFKGSAAVEPNRAIWATPTVRLSESSKADIPLLLLKA